MDGTSQKFIISFDKLNLNSVSLDLDNKRIYWSDMRFKRIKSSDYDGTNRILLLSYESLQSSILFNPGNTAILNNYLYWFDSILGEVSKISIGINGTSIKKSYEIIYKESSIQLMKIVHSNKQKLYENPCYANNCGCQDMCLLTSKKEFRTGFKCLPATNFSQFNLVRQNESYRKLHKKKMSIYG